MEIKNAKTASEFLNRSGSAEDCDLNLYNCAVAFSALFNENFDLERYISHIQDMRQHVEDIYQKCRNRGDLDTVTLRHECIVRVMYDKYEYRGDERNYDDVKNADMMHVVDRRAGLPVALGIIFMQLGREMGWDIVGLSFPGHFILRMTHDGVQILIDPFREGRILQAGDLREILKALMGTSAELSHDYYEEADDHDVLIRLQNNLKTRLIEAEKYEEALRVVEGTRIFVPDEYRLLFDAALLKVKTGQIRGAQEDIVDYIKRAPSIREQQEAEQLLYEIQRQMN
jgi:regulator of sirC expression with transglutaminase-like and TPR domain